PRRRCSCRFWIASFRCLPAAIARRMRRASISARRTKKRSPRASSAFATATAWPPATSSTARISGWRMSRWSCFRYSEVCMNLADFDYELPQELIAQEPLKDRSAARMLVLDRARGQWEDRWFREFPSFLSEGDCVVLNDSRVFPARLYGHRPGKLAPVEVFLLRATSPDGREWQALVRPGR